MRWSNLTMEEEERTRLPGYRDEAVVRHFDAPDSVPTRFYEIRAKSILNRVPEASQMPFRWTINTFRGCTHACAYCLSGETPVLMADGRHRPIAELAVGDAIYGTRGDGAGRRYATTTVLAAWTTLKPAYRVVLEDDTELVLSGDHRLLTVDGWRHVHDAPRDGSRLAVGAALLGTGAFAPQPAHTGDYRRGYVCGLVRAGAHLGHDPGVAPARERAHAFLAAAAIPARELCLAGPASAPASGVASMGPTATSVACEAVPAGRDRRGDRLAQFVAWPTTPTMEWGVGFLAGVFDAAGSRTASAIQIVLGDRETLAWARTCARRLWFEVDRATPAARGQETARIRADLSEQLRFLHLVDPAVGHKRSIEGEPVRSGDALRVIAVESLRGERRMYDITTGTGDFIADGVVSHNCFARPTHTYLDFDAGRDFEREIVVKVNAPERLRAELARPSWQGESVALGTNTDPYQWAEGRYKLMRGIWQAMIDARNPASVLTKSPLLLRDLDLMTELNRRASFGAALSVPTIDEAAWRATEPHTPNPRARLEAVATLTAAGIRTGVLVAPLMPGINDDPEQVREILELCAQAGAAYVTGIALHLRREVRQVFMEWLREHRPDLVDRYRALYRRGAYAPATERRRLVELVESPDRSPWAQDRGSRRAPAPPSPPTPMRASEQERLFEA